MTSPPNTPRSWSAWSKQWHDMTENVLMAPKNECAPVDTKPKPKVHREWTKFEKPLSSPPGKR